jgi:hypothetical protein
VSTVAQVVAAAPSFRQSTKDRPRADVRSREPSKATVTWWVKQNQLDAALAVINGVSETFTLDPGPPAITITRTVPLRHPRWSNLLAVGYTIEEYFSSEAYTTGISCTGPQAKIAVSFETPSWPTGSENPYQKVSARGFSHNLPIDPAAATFSGGGTPGFDVSRPVGGMTYVISVGDASGVTSTQEAAWAAAQGKVNSTTFRGNAAGTVLVGAPNFDYRTDANANVKCDYSLELSVLPVRWDQSIRADGALGTVLVGGAAKHASVDINTLFV